MKNDKMELWNNGLMVLKFNIPKFHYSNIPG